MSLLVVAYVRIAFFLWLNNIYIGIDTVFSLAIYLSIDTLFLCLHCYKRCCSEHGLQISLQDSDFFSFFSFFFLFSFLLLGPHLQHMEVSRLGVESELQPLATTTATQDPSCICDLHHNTAHGNAVS